MIEAGKYIGAGAAAIGMGSAAAGIGSVFAALVSGMARNPSLKQQLYAAAILGFAITEGAGLFCLMISFVILYS